MKYKIEIIDDNINSCYELAVYVWKRKHWYSSETWNWEYSHVIGKNYICPEIFQLKTTVKEMFDKEIKEELKREDLVEIHTINITKNLNYDIKI